MKDISEILKSISSEILTEDVKKTIADLYNESVDSKVATQVQLVVENELKKLDDEHSIKLEKLIEAIDEDHVKKFKIVVEKLDSVHTAKLQSVIDKYEAELKEGADALRGELVGKVSNYLDLYLKDTIPAEQLQEAVENIRAKKMINEIKKIVAVDEEFISENFKDALKDGHDTIEKLKAELNKTIKESATVKQELISTKAQIVLEQKTKDLPDAKKKFVAKLLEGKKPEDIEANFNFVLEMYEKDEEDKKESLLESEKGKSKTVTAKVEPPKTTIKESFVDEGVQDGVSQYLDGFKD